MDFLKFDSSIIFVNAIMFSLLSESYYVLYLRFLSDTKTKFILVKISVYIFFRSSEVFMSFWREKNTSISYLIALHDIIIYDFEIKKGIECHEIYVSRKRSLSITLHKTIFRFLKFFSYLLNMSSYLR